jgi:hypothetical protein
MAGNNHFSAYVYGIDAAGGSTEIAAAGGQLNSFPSAGTHFYPTTAVRGNAQVTCSAVIELLPTGLNQVSTKFYTDSTVATLNTAAT